MKTSFKTLNLFCLFTFPLVLFFFISCEKEDLKNQVSYLQDEVDGLEEVITNVKSENKDLKSNLGKIKRLEKELFIMRAKMDSISQLPGALYSQAHTYYDSEQFDDCMNLLIILSEKYPDWDRQKVKNKYDLANKKKLKIEKEELRLKKINERKEKRATQMVDSIKTNVESIYDEKTGKTYFRTLRSTLCKVSHTVSFGIELYMIEDKGGDREFRMKSTYIDKSGSDYHDPQWMNYNEIELLTDNNKRIIIAIDKLNKELIESRFSNQEKSDDSIDTELILSFFEANRIRVYFKGKYLYEFDMTYEQFNAFREILANYDYL